MWDWIEKSAELKRSGKRFVVLTIAKVIGSVPREVGAKMIVLEEGSFYGTIGGGGLEKNAIAEAVRVLREGGQHVMRLALTPEHGHACGGTVEVLFEVINQMPRVFVFGVGHVGQALCRVLDATPFEVHAIDPRSEWIGAAALPLSTQKHSEDWDVFLKNATWDANSTFVVILTWTHELDYQILEKVLPLPTKYVGVIGSRRKSLAFAEKLMAAGASEAQISKIRCPVGVPVGGKSPQEVAISIGAELLQVFNMVSTTADELNSGMNT